MVKRDVLFVDGLFMLKLKFIFVIFFLIFNVVGSQNNKLFFELDEVQKLRLKQRNNWDARDSVNRCFNNIIHKTLTNNKSCNELPDSTLKYLSVNNLKTVKKGIVLVYAFMNNIVITSKENLKVYSIDNLGGGSYHDYTNYIQYKNKFGECKFILLNKTQEDNSSGCYRIEKVNEYYILFGYGTYGGGKEHYTLRFFKEEKGVLKEKKEILPNQKSLFLEVNRGQEVDLEFDEVRKIISYNTYEQNEETGFYKRKAKRVKLQFIKGKIKRI